MFALKRLVNLIIKPGRSVGRPFSTAVLCLCLVLAVPLEGCTRNEMPVSKTGFYFDTIVTVSLYGKNADETLDECMDLAARYDGLFNKNTKTSDIYKINHALGNPVEVDPDTAELLNLALEFAASSDGKFDPTIGSVSSLWDFKSEDPGLPDPESLAEALKHVDHRNLSVSGNTVTLSDPEASVDPGAIAKGYVADAMRSFCISKGITSGYINLGGNVLTIGSKPSGEAFVVGIKDPAPDSGTAITAVNSADSSVVTSGVYERCFTIDGVDYHHILDTKTGYPVKNNLLSVTVIGPSSATCDALSTILFIMGIDEGSEFIKNYEGYECIFIDEDKNLISK